MDRKPTRKNIKQNIERSEELNTRNGQAGENSETGLEQRGTEELFSRIFSMSPVPIALTTLSNGEVLKINQAFERLSGYTEKEIKGPSVCSPTIFSAL